MGDTTIGPTTPAPSQAQTSTDSSLNDAKGLGLDAGKSFGSALFNGVKKDQSLSLSLQSAVNAATTDLEKTSIGVLTKQFSSDPNSPFRTLLQSPGDGYFTPGQRDIFAKPPDANTDPKVFDPIKNGDGFPFFAPIQPSSSATADPGKEKAKGFDLSLGFPKLGLSPKGSALDLVTKPSPANVKDVTVGEKIELSYRTPAVDLKLTGDAEGKQSFQGVTGWSGLNRGLLLKQGQGSASLDLGVNVRPAPGVSLSLDGGVTASSKLTGADNQRTNGVDFHGTLNLTVTLPGGPNAKLEELLRNEKKPPEQSLDAMAPGPAVDQVEKFVEQMFPSGDIPVAGKK